MTSRQLAVGHGTLTLFEQTGLVDLFALEQAGVAGVGHFDFAQHLANDDLDVLVVDLHALQTVDVLHLVDDVVGERLDAQETQDVVRIRRAVADALAAVLRCLGSVITRLVRPVTSSVVRVTVTPSTKSLKRTRPATSVMTGWVCGSQLAAPWPGSPPSPSSTLSTAPSGTW